VSATHGKITDSDEKTAESHTSDAAGPRPAAPLVPPKASPLAIPWIRIAFGMLIGAACIWQIIQRQGNLHDVINDLLQVKVAWLAVALVLFAIDYAFRVLRWWVLVAALAPGIGPLRCAGPLFAGFALNNILPARMGDVARGALFTRELGLGASAVFATLIQERLVDLLVLLLIFAAGTQTLPPGSIDPRLTTGAGIAAGVAAVAVIVAIALPAQLAKLFGFFAVKIPSVASIARWIAQIFTAIARLRSPRILVPVLVLSLIAWAFELAVFVAVARAVGMVCPLHVPPFAIAAGSLATLVPSTPGQIGPFDICCNKALVACGIAPPLALTFTMVAHAMMLVPLTTAGLGWLLLRRSSPDARAAD